MALGVLEPKSEQKVPGTVYVERETDALRNLTSNLKHGSGHDENIVLVPQPSDSPNDPLSMLKKPSVSGVTKLTELKKTGVIGKGLG